MKKQRRYIILFGNTFRARDWERFGCDAFARLGFGVVAIQVTLGPLGAFPIPVAAAIDEAGLARVLGRIAPDDFVLNLTTLTQCDWVYRWLSAQGAAYAVMSRGGYPFSFRGFRGATGIPDWLRQHGKDVLNLAAGLKQRLEVSVGVPGLLPPRWWIRSGSDPLPTRSYLFPDVRHAEILRMRHFDVETNDALEKRQRPPKPYAVFLDQVMTGHPDFAVLQEGIPVDPARYFSSLRTLFTKVERDLGLPVFVAPHPKSAPNSLKKYDWSIIENGTAAAVRDSSLVLCHDTTAISFAVLNRIPVMFLTNDDLETCYIGVGVARNSSWLGQRRLNIDHLPEILRRPVMREADFARYETTFLRESADILGWAEVASRVAARV